MGVSSGNGRASKAQWPTGSIPVTLTIKGFIFRSDLKQLVYLWWRAVFVGSKVYLFVGWKFVEYSTEKGGFSQWITEVE